MFSSSLNHTAKSLHNRAPQVVAKNPSQYDLTAKNDLTISMEYRTEPMGAAKVAATPTAAAIVINSWKRVSYSLGRVVTFPKTLNNWLVIMLEM